MKIIKPHEGFIVKVHHTLKLPDKVFKHDSFRYWDPVSPGYIERVKLGLDEYCDDLEYYEYFDGERLINTPLLFNEDFQEPNMPLYTKVIEAEFQYLHELLQFPYRNNDFPYYYSDGSTLDILEEFKKLQKQLECYALGIVKGYPKIQNIIRGEISMTERTVYLNGFYQEVSLDKEWKNNEERNRDPEYKEWLLTPVKITIFDGWKSYLLWELLSKVENGLAISYCIKCGSILDIKPGKHRDRQLCGKEENPKCWQTQQREKKAKQRKRHPLIK